MSEKKSKCQFCFTTCFLLNRFDSFHFFSYLGKWFNYSIIVFVMILDLNMWKNQIFYIPAEYGQYTGPDHKVFSIPGIFGEPSEY